MAENDRLEAIASFEADYAKQSGNGELNGIIAVIDLDQWIAGICRVISGKPNKLSETSTSPVGTVFIANDIPFTAICGATYDSVPEGLNEKLKKYIKLGGTKDQQCCVVNGTELNCSMVMDAYNNGYADKVKLLTERMAALISDSGSSLSDIRIVVAGRLSTLFCTMHIIKSCMGSSPFLPDKRFAVYAGDVDPSKLAELGSSLLDKNNDLLNKDVIVVLKRADENQQALLSNRKYLGHRETALKELETPSYIQPFAIFRDDRLNLMSEDVSKEIPMPDEIFKEGEIVVIQIALMYRNNEYVIRVRNIDGIETDIRVDI